MRPGGLLPIAVALGVAGCGAAAGEGADERPARAALDPASNHRLGDRRFAAGCDEPRVTGGLAPDYRRESVVSGPLAIYPARTEFPRMPPDDIGPIRRGARPARYWPIEAAVTVAPGARVTVTVPRAERKRLALLFDPSSWGDANRGYTVAEGDAEVTFPGCHRPYTQYQGGFVVTRPQCADLRVASSGARPVSVRLAFGVRDCGRPG